jgi:ketosteroid isomerase-like protein
MSDVVERMRAWLGVIERGDFAAWEGRVAEDFVMRLPYGDPAIRERRGFAAARDGLAAFWPAFERFAWRDVVIRRTEDPDLVVATAKSEALTTWGQPYANDYVIFTRFRDGQVIEHVEYFNPLLAGALAPPAAA